MLFATLFDASNMIIFMSFMAYGAHVLFKTVFSSDTAKDAGRNVLIRGLSRLFK
jgi:hypothetical protein